APGPGPRRAAGPLARPHGPPPSRQRPAGTPATSDRELADLRGDERELARRADLLRHQIEEIGRARLEAGEEDELRHAQRIHANAEQIIQLAGDAYAAVAGGAEDASSARDLLGAAAQRLAQLRHLDPSVASLAE